MSDSIQEWLDIVGCPYCLRMLQLTNEGALSCPACDHQFAIREGIPALLRGEDADRLASFSRAYRDARLDEGRQAVSEKQALRLPYGSPPGYPRLYWELRRQSYEALLDILSAERLFPERGPVADLGAGTGWLASRLAQVGYRVLAVDASLDTDFGLGASRVYWSMWNDRVLPIQGNLEYPPLQPRTLGLIVYNASLHYAQDLEGTVLRGARALCPGGCLAILDTPISRRPRRGSGKGDRHLGREELSTALSEAGLNPRWIRVRRSWRWWFYQAKAQLKCSPQFSFPIVLGSRETSTELHLCPDKASHRQKP